MRLRLPTLLLACLALEVGCAARRARRGASGLQRELQAADARFAERADPAAADQALRMLLDLQDRHTDDPRVLWRLARAYTLQGYRKGPAAGRSDLLTGRELALRCLRQQPEFDGVVQGAGGVVTAEAIGRLTVEDRPCLLWGTLSWARYLHWQGPGGLALDLDVVEAMAQRTAEMGGGVASLVLEARGLAVSARPVALEGDPAAAVSHFEAAIAATPDRLSLPVDLAVYALRPAGLGDRASRLLAEVAAAALDPASGDLAEDRRAQERAKAALEGARGH